MTVQSTLDDRNYRALELFTDGRFAEAAKIFTVPEYRCASLLNAGDRAGLLSEPVSYDQRLFLLAARGWSQGRVLKGIAMEGLCEEPHSLAHWIGLTRTPGRLPAKRFAENLIAPAIADREGAPSFLSDQLEIDKLILSRDFEAAGGLLQVARGRWGDRPSFRLSEARVLLFQDRRQALKVALRLTQEFPDYFQGLTFAVTEAMSQLTSGMDVPREALRASIEICERGSRLDPGERVFVLRHMLKLAVNKRDLSGFVGFAVLVLGYPVELLRQRTQLSEIRRLAAQRGTDWRELQRA